MFDLLVVWRLPHHRPTRMISAPQVPVPSLRTGGPACATPRRARGGRGRPATVAYQSRACAGCRTQWFSSGKYRNLWGTRPGPRLSRSDHSRSASPTGTRWSRSPWITSIGVLIASANRCGLYSAADLRGQLAAPVVRRVRGGDELVERPQARVRDDGGEAVGVPGHPVGQVAAERAAHGGRAPGVDLRHGVPPRRSGRGRRCTAPRPSGPSRAGRTRARTRWTAPGRAGARRSRGPP